jgi:VWFA-related protein
MMIIMRTDMVIALALTALAAQPPAQVPAPPARADLWIDVVALDSRAAPLTDLRPDEFEVWISGYRIPITDVVAVTPESQTGRTMVVILDNAAVPPALVPRVKEAARLLVRRMSPGDRVSIVSLHGGEMESTTDQTELLRAIDSYHVQGFPFRLEDAGEHVLRTFASLSRQLAEAPGRRRTIVAIGAGWMFDTPLPPPGLRDLSAEWIAAERAMAATHTSLYVIDPAGLGVGRGPSYGGDSGFAHATGGYAFRNTNDVQAAVERIWQETGSYYLLGVVNPPVRRAADLRELEVKVLRKGVAVRTRRALTGRP